MSCMFFSVTELTELEGHCGELHWYESTTELYERVKSDCLCGKYEMLKGSTPL